MRIVFLGTGEIGLPTLRYLLAQSEHELVGVVTQPDRPTGRKLIPSPPAVKVLAQSAGVPVMQPEKIREFLSPLRQLDADLFVVVAYGQLLSQTVIDIPKLVCVNLHASLLPRHRGASPIQAAILAGDTTTAMTVMFVELGLDSGPVLLSEPVDISPQETGGSLHDKLADIGPRALARALPLLATGNAPRTPQDNTAMSHCRKLTREHGVIDWNSPASELERKIRAFAPWPGTSTRWPANDGTNKLMKIFPPVSITDHSGEPGTVAKADKDGLLIHCGKGAILIQEIQVEGKRRMTVRDFFSGIDTPVGLRLL